VLTSLKTIGITELPKQVGDKKCATIWQDEVQVAGSLFGDDDATQTQTGNNNKATIDQGDFRK
jgi:hypothetical protein